MNYFKVSNLSIVQMKNNLSFNRFFGHTSTIWSKAYYFSVNL